MSPRQIARARQVLGLVGRTRERVPFFYVAAGPDGLPTLLVAPETLEPGDVLNARQSASEAVFVSGFIERGADQALVFRLRSEVHAERFVTDLGSALEEMIPGLNLARVDLA